MYLPFLYLFCRVYRLHVFFIFVYNVYLFPVYNLYIFTFIYIVYSLLFFTCVTF